MIIYLKGCGIDSNDVEVNDIKLADRIDRYGFIQYDAF